MEPYQPPAGGSDLPENHAPQLQVVVHAGPLAGKGFLFRGDTITFGRDPDNDIAWEDTQVSRHHARITQQDDRLILEDLGSTNGTLVNGKPIEGPHILQPADIISIGSSVFGVKGFAAPQTVAITQVTSSPPGMAPLAAQPRPSAPRRRVAPRTPGPVSPKPQQPRAKRGGMNILAIAAIITVILVILGLAALTAYFVYQGQRGADVPIPTVVITAPISGSQVQVGQPVMVQTTASDASGVVRMELWVSGVRTAQTTSPSSQGQPTLTASMQWVPQAPGSYTLEVKAFNVQSQVNEPTTISVSAVERTASETSTPTATPATPTPTVPSTPRLTTLTDLNVRSGPGTIYDLIGLLPVGASAEIVGQDETREWWQVRFALGIDGVAWVAADPEFSTTTNVDDVPIVPAPPTPTGTPTDTPTATPTKTTTPTSTSTPVPVTNTPTPTETPGSQVTIEFSVTPTTIEGGDCVEVSWNVDGVKAVYYQNEGVAGTGKRTECPLKTTTYTLKVIKQDDTETTEQETVKVTVPIASSGTTTLPLGQSIDFDKGQIPGNDFVWREVDEFRLFEVLAGVAVSPQGIASSLDSLTFEKCTDADFDEFTYLDGSDVILDPNNELTDGRTACYITNEGRLGKLRFPQYSTGAIKVEWLTWD